jgi:ABC-2 type transport system permease protein
MRANLAAAVRYEWLRTRSVRSTWGLVLALCSVNALATLSLGQGFLNGSRSTASPSDVVRLLTGGSIVASVSGATLLAGLLGVLLGGQDQLRGMAGTTLLAVPRRGVLFAARLIVTACWAAGASVAALVVSYAIAWQRIGHGWGLGVLSRGHVVAALAGQVVLAVLTAGLGLGLVALLRRTVLAAAALLAVPLLLEPAAHRVLLHHVAAGWARTAMDYLPFRAASDMVDLASVQGSGSTLWSSSAALGGVLFVVLVAAALAAGGATLLNRDV